MILSLVLLMLIGLNAQASTPAVVFDSLNTVGELQSFVATLFVNGTPFVLAQTCASSSANVTCVAPLPNIASALTPTGQQTFTVQLSDPVLGVTSPMSVPFIRNRPGAPTSGRFQ